MSYFKRFFTKQITNQKNYESKPFLSRTKLTLATLACSALVLTGIQVHAAINNNLETIYHVYVDGERIGAIDNKDTYETLANEKLETYKTKYETYDLTIGQEVQIIPERVFQARATTSATMEKLGEILTVEAEATAMIVNGEEVAYVPNQEVAQKVVDAYKLQYISAEQLAAYEKKKDSLNGYEKQEVGYRSIYNIELSTPITYKETIAPLDQILDIESAVKKIKLGTLEEKKYSVQPGDVLGSIAEKHGLSTAELLQLNPSITEDTLLQIDQKLSVTYYEPLVKVTVHEAVTIKEEIPFETETKEDSTMWKGDTKVTQEGRKGMRVVSYDLVEENGVTIKREIKSEDILNEPVNRVVVRGTKESPSRGTGSLGWPAVGGYISSYQGARWGRFHKGIDIARPSNLNILAADNGTVTFAGWDGGYGNKVLINHNNGIVTLYGHLDSIDVSVGQTVGKGQPIGIMGNTGNSTGTHLHLEVYKNGELQNPMDYLTR